MDNLQIDDGTIRLTINGDANRILSFNPKDELFAEKFYHLVGNFKKDLQRFEERAKPIDDNNELDEDGLPVNLQSRFDIMKDVCAYVRNQIDEVFGTGTSNIVFGTINNIGMFEMFFKQITPYMAQARSEKVSKYIPTVQKPKGSRRQK